MDPIRCGAVCMRAFITVDMLLMAGSVSTTKSRAFHCLSFLVRVVGDAAYCTISCVRMRAGCAQLSMDMMGRMYSDAGVCCCARD